MVGAKTGLYYQGKVAAPRVRSSNFPVPRVTTRNLEPGTRILSDPLSNASRNDGLDSPPDVEVADDLHGPRLSRLGKIVENAVHGALVEDAVVAEAPEVELQALELDADLTWHVGDVDRPKVRC